MRYQPFRFDFCKVVDSADGTERHENQKSGNRVAVQFAGQQRNDADDHNKKQPPHNGRGFDLAVLVKIRSGIRLLQKADVGRHGGENEKNRKQGRNSSAEQATVKKRNIGKMIDPFAKHAPNVEKLSFRIGMNL